MFIWGLSQTKQCLVISLLLCTLTFTRHRKWTHMCLLPPRFLVSLSTSEWPWEWDFKNSRIETKIFIYLSPKDIVPIFKKNCTRQPYLPNLHKVLQKSSLPQRKDKGIHFYTIARGNNNTLVHKEKKHTHNPPSPPPKVPKKKNKKNPRKPYVHV
jgi:hypothetical protein